MGIAYPICEMVKRIGSLRSSILLCDRLNGLELEGCVCYWSDKGVWDILVWEGRSLSNLNCSSIWVSVFCSGWNGMIEDNEVLKVTCSLTWRPFAVDDKFC